ncbi:hypothetical protein ACGFI4_15795 [Micromonospora carbonacea]|uniref:hypothetical protein n=1 Tax=Micromonospora carbonacea TaxID=47853 RepID=UPI003716E3B9
MVDAYPEGSGRPFTRWSMRNLAGYLCGHAASRVRIGRERLRQILHRHTITFQWIETWKESTDSYRDTEPARIEYVSGHFPAGRRSM